MSDLSAVGARLGKLQAALSGEHIRQITETVTWAAKKDAMKELVTDVGGDLKMSGWKRIKFGVTYDMTSDHSSEVKPKPSAPFMVLDQGRRRAVAPIKKRGVRKMVTPWGVRSYTKASPLNIGPTRGKHTWKRATRQIALETPRRVQVEVTKVMKGIFN